MDAAVAVAGVARALVFPYQPPTTHSPCQEGPTLGAVADAEDGVAASTGGSVHMCKAPVLSSPELTALLQQLGHLNDALQVRVRAWPHIQTTLYCKRCFYCLFG